jgi:hypothetical protein
MLFDLRSRGRKNTVKVVYTSLAVLMAAGLVFFGVGGAVGGGLLDAFNSSNSSSSSSDVYSKRIDQAEAKTKKNPQDAAAWATLAKYRVQAAGAEDYDQTSGQYTKDGLAQLRQASTAWNKYLALKPPKPDSTTAQFMVQALGALNQPAGAVKAMEVVLDSRSPTAGLYSQYAQLAYVAGQTRKGDLAAAKAVSLTPKAQQKSLKSSLDQVKASVAQQQIQQAQGAASATTG